MAGLVTDWLRSGCIFEISKRRFVQPLVHMHIGVYVVVIAANIYATARVLQKDPKLQPLPAGSTADLVPEESWPLLAPLIIGTWVVIAAVLALLLLTWQMFPDQTRLETWRHRFRCLFLFSFTLRYD